MSKGVCEQIDQIEKYITFDSGSQNYKFNDILKAYCPNKNCDTDEKILGSAFTALVENLKSIDDEKPEDIKLGQYAILWLSYKIRENTNIKLIRNTIYDILTQNEWFSEYRQYTDKNEDIMGFHFLYFKRLYDLLKGICETINKCSNSSNNEECINSAKKCDEFYRICILSAPWKEICNPYCSVLSNLKNDYDKLRKNNDQLPELTLPKGVESCENLCNGKQKWEFAKLKFEVSKIDTPTKVSLPVPSVTPTSVNNANKLSYIAVPLILIPIILGFSYKYLTPVWRKKAKRKAMKKIINLSDQKKA
ncbi:CIR protein [Plasmodium chabaudi chabaudi]|uniref:CIR protein n=1 Tax=Plasmodium chabaudi chabaudi TaxID=31271 RepID=A0A4V0K5F1_PLACU|nr:CIR protein [Plasmodium chabaudi chabaudi]VTZ67343.1 CIR protein [Plasmodium chabaudi chabaudi]|eukprot:XP_016655131.1 CIR protein [Plasmodium chabaudi chabaudi]